MTLDSLSRWLRCPICFADLSPSAALSLACLHGHSYDVAKRGYVTLLPPRTKVHGDSAEMLDARQGFLDAGHYAPLEAALDGVLPRSENERILDAGCGTGHYLRRLLGTRPTANALAADLSPSAVARAVRSPGVRVDGLVADLWAPLPLRDAAATILLNVFAPRNPPEFARVLERNGVLLVVAPAPDHLTELRSRGLVLGMQDDKIAKIQASLVDLFSLEEERVVRFPMHLDRSAVGALVGMGPSAYHRTDASSAAADDPPGDASTESPPVTAAMRVLLYRRR
ncbi:putative RNA methyltransferase [Planctomonas psychrotolerans]|uniref:putative RNA methyltransferase n=1 Tax=Planctomonas psychrotolerans TaxID=2528712 RepID=UPI001239F5DF|nr:methyltransferase domain-containing protein [Planctomonas psychrotolerans]